MDNLTPEQVKAVDRALWDIGIKYLDIRIEMTDHAVAAIEAMDGSFERKLKKYIFENKKELKKNYSQFRTNASVKAVKLLMSNMFTFRFLLILASAYALLYAEYKYEGIEERSWAFFMLTIASVISMWMYTGYVNFTKSTKLFSTAERLFPSMAGIAYLMIIPLRGIIDELEINDAVKLLYYAFCTKFLHCCWHHIYFFDEIL